MVTTDLRFAHLVIGVTTTATTSLGPHVRRAERTDLTAVYRIEQAAFPQPWHFGAFETFLGQAGFLVAVDPSVVGFIIADINVGHDRPLGHVKDFAVRADRRREGIGTTLLSQALGVLDQSTAATAVKLEVRESNTAAIDLYRRHGFEYRRTLPEYYAGGEDALVLLRPL